MVILQFSSFHLLALFIIWEQVAHVVKIHYLKMYGVKMMKINSRALWYNIF